MTVTKKASLTLCVLFGLLAVSSIIVTTLPDASFFGASSVSTCYLLLLSVAFYYYISWVTIKSPVRNNLLCCGVLFAVIFLLRGARYTAFMELDQVMRYLWYFYYIPLLFIPFFSFRAAISVGKPEEMKYPKWQWALGAVSTVLVVLVVTNDIHQWAFHLNPGFREHWIDRYTYGPLYYIVYAWIATVLLSSLFIMFRKCSIATCRKQVWAPIISGAFGIFWLIMIALGRIPNINGHLVIEFPEAFCFTVAACWICCIQIGLVPANKSYATLFEQSSIRADITDSHGNIIYSGKDSSAGEVGETKQEDIRIQRKAIRGGYVSWQTDISEIRQINESLETIGQQLEEETELLRLENELKEKNKTLEAKNAVYDAIAVRVLPQSAKISALSSHVAQSDRQETNSLQMICLYGCYIKRMSNLMLIAAQQDTISEMEFSLAVGESVYYIRKFGIVASIFADDSQRSYPAKRILAAYETFEQYVEQLLPDLIGVQVNIVENYCKLTLECKKEQMPLATDNATVEWDDGTAFITIPLAERGTVL